MPIYIHPLNAKIRLAMLCLSGFELYSRWVPLKDHKKTLPVSNVCFSGASKIGRDSYTSQVSSVVNY